jgi:drug/metabolite transporter (DMT)-like permease
MTLGPRPARLDTAPGGHYEAHAMSQPVPRAPSALVAYALLTLVCLAWGSTWLVIKWGLSDLPPLTAAALRFLLAGGVMAALAPWLAPREGGGRPPWSAVVVQGICQFAFNYALVYYAERFVPSGLVSVLWSVFPLFVALAGHFITKAERLHAGQWIGGSLAFLGVVVLFITDVSSLSRDALAWGLLVLLAPAAVTGSTLLAKQRAAGSSSVLLNRDSMLLGSGILCVLALIFEHDEPRRWSAGALGSVAYLALVGTVFTFGVYMWLLRHLPAYLLSLTSFVVPALALLFGALAGGEALTLTTVAGACLVLLGVGLTLRPRASARRARALA